MKPRTLIHVESGASVKEIVKENSFDSFGADKCALTLKSTSMPRYVWEVEITRGSLSDLSAHKGSVSHVRLNDRRALR